MKSQLRNPIASVLLAGFSLAVCGSLSAAQPDKAHKSSAEFDKMKTLVGTWTGKADMGHGMEDINIEYRLISGGTAIEERTFAGSPKEMVTMYHDRNGKLFLTHYCMLANQPGMALKSADSKSLHFDFDATCGVNPKTEMHMHSLAITFDGPDTIVQDWTLYEDGKPKDHHPFTLTRVKS